MLVKSESVITIWVKEAGEETHVLFGTGGSRSSLLSLKTGPGLGAVLKQCFHVTQQNVTDYSATTSKLL